MFEGKEKKFLGQGLASSSANTVLTFEDIYEATMTVSCSLFSLPQNASKAIISIFLSNFSSQKACISFLMVFFFSKGLMFFNLVYRKAKVFYLSFSTRLSTQGYI